MNADDIKKSDDLAEYTRSRGVVLRKRGKDLVGLCPFHQDSKPSLVVTPSERLWHCLGCNAGGSVIDFVMKLDGVDVKAAMKLLRGTLSPATPAESMTAAERKDAEAFGRSPDLIARILGDFETCGLVGEKANAKLSGGTPSAEVTGWLPSFCLLSLSLS